MRVENDVSFKGRIKNPINSKNGFVRYSINYLKHYVGGRNVEHGLVLNENANSLMVTTRLFPKERTSGVYGNVLSLNTFKRLDLISKEKITQQISEITQWIKRMQAVKN